MRKFKYFFYENYDPDGIQFEETNQRSQVNSQVDAILSVVADYPPYTLSYETLCSNFPEKTIQGLLTQGVLSLKEGKIVFDSPIFLREDFPILQYFFATQGAYLANLLEEKRDCLLFLANKIHNGFEPERNLYHILCCHILDGLLFDSLSEKGIVATSRQHPSGLDFLVILYENCAELNCFSDGLLCSCNRFTDGHYALESFGDSNGKRVDFYRFLRMRESGLSLPATFDKAQNIYEQTYRKASTSVFKSEFFSEFQKFIQTGICYSPCIELLEAFGYTKNGKLCVPVFRSYDQDTIFSIYKLVENVLLEPICKILSSLDQTTQLSSCVHGVPIKEIANESYHIVFGQLNENLVDRGLVSTPECKIREGRYLKSIAIS